MRVRLQADADLDQAILFAVIRHEPAIDFQSAVVAGLANRSDMVWGASEAEEWTNRIIHLPL